MDRSKAKAKSHNVNSKKLTGGKDAKRGRKKFSVSPRGRKHRDERLPRMHPSLCKDPLNLAALIGKGGSDSPQNSSPVVERSHDFEPMEGLVTNASDPLQLDVHPSLETPGKSSAKKKRKRKRRHTYHGEDIGDREVEENFAEQKKKGKKSDLPQNGEQDLPTSGDEVFGELTDDVSFKDASGKQSSETEGLTPSKRAMHGSVQEKQPDKKVNSSKKQLQFKKTDKTTTNFRSQDQKFKYGNYNRYYGYRNPNMAEDVRIPLIQRDWIVGKDCLDIGCNVGHVSLWISRHMHPKTMVGVDIDSGLINAAQNNVRHYLPTKTEDAPCQSDFPISFALCHGPLAAPVCAAPGSEKYGFPYNVTFYMENYVPASEEELAKTEPKFDTIICFSVTKWIHLNWGDAGLKRMFRKVYMHLRPGGKFLLEPQPFKSYKRKKNISPEIRANYDAIELHPDKFIPYLLSKEVGFATSEALDNAQAKIKGFQRPIFVLTKSEVAGAKGDS